MKIQNKLKTKKSILFIGIVFSILLFSSVFALIASGGNFSVIQFFSGIAGGEASGGIFDARFHSTAFQPVGKGAGGVFSATVGPLSSNVSSQAVSGYYNFNLTDPTDQTVSNSSTAVYTITLTNNGTLDDSYTLSVSNANNASTVQLNTSSISNLVAGSSAQFTLTVGSSVAGNYTTNITSVSQGNFSLTRTISIVTSVTSLPIISSYLISPYVVINGSNVTVYISALGADNIYGQITRPDSSTQMMNLINNANVTFSNTTLLGGYNVTLFANNSQGIVNTSDYFESFVPAQFNFNIVDSNTTGVNSSWEIQYRDQVISSNDSSSGNHSLITPGAIVDLMTKSHSNRLQITLMNINVSLENRKSFGMDKLSTPVSGYLLTYGIENNYSFTNATVRIYYDDVSFTTESNLKFDKCDDWDFTSRSCSGSFVDVTSSAMHNNAENYFEYVTTNFSGFGIREVSSPPPSDGGGSSGGGGGGSSCTYNQNYDWGCGEWSQCNNGIQTRICKVTNNCGNTFGRPETQRSCIEEPELSPEELFDIFLELEDASLTSSSELVARIRFESFGTIPTHVDLTYIIVDSLDNEVYREKGEIVVETEEILTKQFEDLNLPDGKYTLVLTTVYGDNVIDEFRQEFEVKREKKLNLVVYLVFSLLVILILAIISYLIYRKRKYRG